jgi:hypothetical protein
MESLAAEIRILEVKLRANDDEKMRLDLWLRRFGMNRWTAMEIVNKTKKERKT